MNENNVPLLVSGGKLYKETQFDEISYWWLNFGNIKIYKNAAKIY